jgi:two-component system KDP operon response regulator KdpE
MPVPSAAPPAILIVDDEPAIRRLIRNTLVRAGYVTLEANSAVQALSVIRSYSGKIQLAILDFVMPGGGGLDLANQLDVDLPGTTILYISGLVHSVAVASLAQQQPRAILTKPFTGAQLLARVRELLDQPPSNRPG